MDNATREEMDKLILELRDAAYECGAFPNDDSLQKSGIRTIVRKTEIEARDRLVAFIERVSQKGESMLKRFGSLIIDPETVSAVACGANPAVYLRDSQGHLTTIYLSAESVEALAKHFSEEEEQAGVVVFRASIKGGVPEPIPPRVYYSVEHDYFYHMDTKNGMGYEFHRKWKRLRDQFPKRPVGLPEESTPRFTISEDPSGILDRESPGMYAPIPLSHAVDRKTHCDRLNSGSSVFAEFEWRKIPLKQRFTVSEKPCGILDSLRPGFIAEFTGPEVARAIAGSLNAGKRSSSDFEWSELPEPPAAQDEWPPETTIAWHVRAMKETVSAYERCLQSNGTFIVPAGMKCEIRFGDAWNILHHPMFSEIPDRYYRLVPVE